MTLLVKDANTQTQPLSTQVDAAANLVPVHASASVSGGVATPVGPANPLPVTLSPGTAVAVDGSGTVTNGGTAQTLFGGTVPVNGFLVANLNATGGRTLYVSDVGAASAAGASIPILPQTIFATPTGYRPGGVVSLFGQTTGDAFAARRW